MFKVKRRIRSIRDSKKQSRTNGEPIADQGSFVASQRGILKSDNSCRSSQSPNSPSIWASNSSPSASATEEAPSQQHGAGSRSAGSTERNVVKKSRRVNFDSVRIREYERTLGDNPSCSSGAPITIGWAHGKESKVNINEYESVRQRRRNQKELTLSRMAREDLLLEWGATFNEIIDAIRTNVKIKHQRRRTVNSIGTYDKWEEAMERAGRRLKKTLLPQKASGSNKNGKNMSSDHQKYIKTSASDSPVSSLSSEPVAGNTAVIINASEDASQTTIRRAKLEDGIRNENMEGDRKLDPDATEGVPVLVSRESFSSSRPTPLIEIPSNPSCASAMSVLEDDFDEDGYDDFEDLLDPYVTDEGNRMYPPEIQILNGHSDYDTDTLTGSYAGYSMYSAEGFETLARDHSHWQVESGSTNSGPKVKPVFNPITIYEDGPDDPGQFQTPIHFQSIDLWQRAGFQVQPPPHSSSLTTHWE